MIIFRKNSYREHFHQIFFIKTDLDQIANALSGKFVFRVEPTVVGAADEPAPVGLRGWRGAHVEVAAGHQQHRVPADGS